jgi:hypothetical protein
MQGCVYLFSNLTKQICGGLLTVFDCLYSPRGPWPPFNFLIYSQLVGFLGQVFSSTQGLYLNTGKNKHRKTTYTHQTSMP